MRILISRASLSKGRRDELGGAEKAAINLCESLVSLGHEPILLAGFPINKQAGFKTIKMPSSYGKLFPRIRYVANTLLLFPYLLTISLLRRPELINPQSREDQIVFTLLKPLHKKPVVWKDAGDLRYYLVPKSGFAKIMQNILINAIQKADAIYTVSESDMHNLLNSLKALGVALHDSKVLVVPSDIKFSDYDLTEPPPAKSRKTVIGIISKLEKYKGVQYLFKAIRNLDNKNIEIWIIGDGPYRSQLNTMAEGLDITFWGYQSNVSSFLNGIDILVQPAEQEGWGRTVKEAMYFGKPVIGSRVGGIAAQIDDGENGLLFKPKDSIDLANQLNKLLSDSKLRESIGSAAHKKVMNEGDYENLVNQKIMPLFDSIVQSQQK